MEEYAFVLNKCNLSHYCGDGHVFKEYQLVAELKPKAFKKQKKRKHSGKW